MRSVTATLRCVPSVPVITSVASLCGTIGMARSMSMVSSPCSPNDCHESLPLNCNGSTPMPDQVAAVDALEALAITALTPSSWVPFAAQSRLEPVPYSSPAKITVGVPAAK